MLNYARQIANEIAKPHLRFRKHAGVPSEGFSAHISLDRIEAHSSSDLGCTYAATQLATAIRADHLAEFLGEQAPRFPLRPVWFGDLPASSLQETCQLLATCGFNALVTEAPPAEKTALKVIQKVTHLSDASAYADYLLLEFTPSGNELLELEAAEQQIQRWEEHSGEKGLIIYLKAETQEAAGRQAVWLPELCDRCGDRTILAFSAMAGPATSIELPLHPLWERLRHLSWPSATPLMPVVNAGCIHLGEGLWPISSAGAVDEILSYMGQHTFAGLLCLAGAVPPPKGLAACNLWTAGQAQWQDRSAFRLLDTWMRAHRPDLDLELLQTSSREADQLIRKISLLRSGKMSNEEARALSDLIVSRLSYFSRKSGAQSDQVRYFCRDAWCLLVDALNTLRLPLTPILMHADLGGGFWTEAGPANKVSLRSSPQPKLDDPNMIRLFHENR